MPRAQGLRAYPDGCRFENYRPIFENDEREAGVELLAQVRFADKKIEPRPCQLSSDYAASSEAGARIGS